MNLYQEYCTGCGLCQSVGKCALNKDERGFLHPSNFVEMFDKVCPISGIQTKNLDKNEIWGRNEAVYLGWSKNASIRNKASSGGILTEVACWLLTGKKVDGVIQTGAATQTPTKTETVLSRTPEEVVSHCGSRYCISSPLSILGSLEKNKHYAFIGKPCDVVALRNFMETTPEYKERIPYLLSFFCMGLPSDEAQKRLLTRLSCSECRELTYRGNGWPGYTTATDGKGEIHRITYDESWGKILGRDLMPACKFCIDGIGEMADISCGDAWYLTEENKPDFSEHDGRNVVFARTEKGNRILSEMKSQGIISLNIYKDYREELPWIQTSQWNRRREMKDRILAMRLMQKEYPLYDSSLLRSYAKGLPIKKRVRIILGTGRRILKGKI